LVKGGSAIRWQQVPAGIVEGVRNANSEEHRVRRDRAAVKVKTQLAFTTIPVENFRCFACVAPIDNIFHHDPQRIRSAQGDILPESL
jgi:hypothetical protein